LHPKAKSEKEVQIDTTVQEKNITFSTDAKTQKMRAD
jgi:IS5 family transposase